MRWQLKLAGIIRLDSGQCVQESKEFVRHYGHLLQTGVKLLYCVKRGIKNKHILLV